MQGKKTYQEKLFTRFLWSERVPKHNFYQQLKSALDLNHLYKMANSTLKIKVQVLDFVFSKKITSEPNKLPFKTARIKLNSNIKKALKKA